MAAVARKTACVTGGNGYVASALIKMLLEKGYAVKTTVRDPDNMEKTSHFKELKALGPLEVFRADLDVEGSFDEAVAGCDYAFLVAAPVYQGHKSVDLEKEIIEAGVQGTLNVLRSCVKAGKVKRVILTSSTASVSSRPLQGGGHVLDEESWSDIDHLRAQKHFTPTEAYAISKVLIEKEASKFAKENGIDLVTLCAVVTVGVAPAVKVHTSVPVSLSLLSGDEEMIHTLKHIERASGSMPMVHIDDVCRAEIFVAEKESASGRYICGSVNTTVVEIARFLKAKYPQYNVKTDSLHNLPEKPTISLSSEKLISEGFEFKYKTLDEMYDDLVGYGRALGVLPY